MEDVYALYQHEYCALFELNEDVSYINIFNIALRESDDALAVLTENTCITYNKHALEVVNWGKASFEAEENDTEIKIDDFMDGLYKLFEKDEKTWNEKDIHLKKAVSDFLSLALNKLIQDKSIVNKNLDSFHYGFIVPSEWEEEIREDLIRPIFLQAGLLSKDDHKDRLLFVTELECLCYTKRMVENFKRGQHTIVNRLCHFDDGTISIKLDLTITSNTLFDFPGSRLFPKLIRSDSFYIGYDIIEGWIKTFIKDKLLINDDQTDIIREMTECIYNDIALKKICEDNYSGDRTTYKDDYEHFYYYEKPYEYEDEELEKFLLGPLSLGKIKCVLNDSQKLILKSLRRFDLWWLLGKPLFDNIKNLLSNNLTKKYFILDEQYIPYMEGNVYDSVSSWIQFLFRCSILDLKKIVRLSLIQADPNNASEELNCTVGIKTIGETVKFSEICSIPCIIPTENLTTSSSVFLYSKPDVIINIDISLKFTIISQSLLSEDGFIKEPFDRNYFVVDKCLPSLKHFYNVSNVVTLNIKEQFISFAEKYLLNDCNSVCMNGDFLSKVKNILYKDYSNETNAVSIHHHKYIEAFFLMYLIYMKEMISKKLLIHTKLNNTAMKIGYAITIEKLLLSEIIGSKENLQKLVYKSGLVEKDDDNTKLRIITQGEGMLTIIQQVPGLDFPVKSYFVLTQLREDYIQLTLNQVVSASSLEEKQQEAIIIKDEIIPIENIYDSLCQNMWDSLVEDESLILLCDRHSKSNDNDKISELFSLESKTQFMSNLKNHISNNILNSNLSLENMKEGILDMCPSCNCKVHLKVNDIVRICFKPVLQNITTTVMSSLINECIFGEYTYIKYMFTLVYWNRNPQFHKNISKILDTEPDYFNPKRGIETVYMVLPELPSQLLLPTPKLQPFLYKGFKTGTLHQVYKENYWIEIDSDINDIKSFFVNEKKVIPIEISSVSGCKYLPIFKKGDIISDTEVKIMVYIEALKNGREHLVIGVSNYGPSDSEVTGVIKTLKCAYEFSFREDEKCNFAIVFTAKRLGHLSSIQFSLTDISIYDDGVGVMERGNPMTLCRL